MTEKIKIDELKLNAPGSDICFENYSYVPKDEKKAELGEVFFMMEVLNATEAKAKEIGKTVFETVKKYFYAHEEKTSYERFEEALKQVNVAVRNVLGHGENKARVNAVVAGLCGGELHLSQTGYAEAYLARSETFTLISEGLYTMENDEEMFQNIASGMVENKDKLVFSSERILRFASEVELAKIFKLKSEDAVSEMRDIVTLEGVENINIMVGQMGKVEVEDVKAGVIEPSSPLLARLQDWARDLEGRGVSRNTLLGVLGAIVLVLILSVWVLGSSRDAQVNQQMVENALQQIQVDIDNANRLALIGKKSEAGEILNRAESELEDLLGSNAGQYTEELAVLLERLDTERDSIDEIFRLGEGNVLVDLTGVRNGVQALGMINANDDRKFVYDKNAIFETILNEVHDPVTIDQNVEVVDGANFSEMGSLVFMTKENGLVEYEDGSVVFASTDDEAGWKPGVALATYSKYVYVLDPSAEGNGQIWKYESMRTGYKDPVAYNVDADLTNAKDLAIDGSIWFLTSDGYIGKLFKGEHQDITVEDEPSQSLDDPTRMHTTAEMKNIYVLDPNNHRVVSYFKDINNPSLLVYAKQYVYDEEMDVRDIFVDNAEQTLYLLTADKITEFEI